MNQAIRKLSGLRLLVLPVLLAALLLLLMPGANAAYECTAQLPVKVELNGSSSERFTVTITPKAGAPGAENNTLHIRGNSKGTFEIHFTKPGNYVYTVKQTPGSTPYMYYDDTVYTVTIQVTNDGNGGLTYGIYAHPNDDTGGKAAEVVFVNTYSPPTPPPPTSRPTSSEPTPSQPVSSEPTTSEPVTSEPVTSQPVTSQPTSSEPTTSEPGTSSPNSNPAIPGTVTPGTSTPNPPTGTGGGGTTAPKTGDNSPLVPLMVLLVVAAVAIVVLVIVMRKKQNDQQNGQQTGQQQ